jgi:hypothetical protein
LFKIIEKVGSVKTDKAHIKVHRSPESLEIYIVCDLWEDLWQSYPQDANIVVAIFEYLEKIKTQKRQSLLCSISSKPIDLYYAGKYIATLVPV